MSPEASNPILATRHLWSQLQNEELGAEEFARLAVQLAEAGRPDLAQRMLDQRFPREPANEALLEALIGNTARLGDIAAVRTQIAALPAGKIGWMRRLRALSALDRGCGHQILVESTIRGLVLSAIKGDAGQLLALLPKPALVGHLGAVIGFACSSLREMPRCVPGLLFLLLLSHLHYAIWGILHLGLRVGQGGRRVSVGTLGNFPRLADVVDRLDPVLRASLDQPDTRILIFHYGGYPNTELMALYGQHVRFLRPASVLHRKLLRLVEGCYARAGKLLPLTTDYRFFKDAARANPAVIGFQAHRATELDQRLHRAGIDPSRPLIVFGLRDMAYYRHYSDIAGDNLGQTARGRTAHRCPPLANYLTMAAHWAERGYQVVRMGLRVSEFLPDTMPAGVVDYAAGERDDAMDAYLMARCRFMVAGDTGLFSGAAAFDRPSVVSDLFLIRNTIYSSHNPAANIFMPKLVRSRHDGTLLPFAELVYFNKHFSFEDDCEALGVEFVHNEPEDILAATLELAERMDGQYVEPPDVREMRQAFRRIYAPYQVGYESTAVISQAFLRKHADLL